MLLKKLTVVCPMCEDVVAIKASEATLNCDSTNQILVSFHCPKCESDIVDEVIENDEDD